MCGRLAVPLAPGEELQPVGPAVGQALQLPRLAGQPGEEVVVLHVQAEALAADPQVARVLRELGRRVAGQHEVPHLLAPRDVRLPHQVRPAFAPLAGGRGPVPEPALLAVDLGRHLHQAGLPSRPSPGTTRATRTSRLSDPTAPAGAATTTSSASPERSRPAPSATRTAW